MKRIIATIAMLMCFATSWGQFYPNIALYAQWAMQQAMWNTMQQQRQMEQVMQTCMQNAIINTNQEMEKWERVQEALIQDAMLSASLGIIYYTDDNQSQANDQSSNNSTYSSSATNSSSSSSTCSLCGGKGRISKEDGLSFGLEKKWCDECKREVVSGHYHTICPLCHGKK